MSHKRVKIINININNNVNSPSLCPSNIHPSFGFNVIVIKVPVVIKHNIPSGSDINNNVNSPSLSIQHPSFGFNVIVIKVPVVIKHNIPSRQIFVFVSIFIIANVLSCCCRCRFCCRVAFVVFFSLSLS